MPAMLEFGVRVLIGRFHWGSYATARYPACVRADTTALVCQGRREVWVQCGFMRFNPESSCALIASGRCVLRRGKGLPPLSPRPFLRYWHPAFAPLRTDFA
jgi:hypothetical protein